MFKQYIENHSSSLISQIYSHYQKEEISNDKKQKELSKKAFIKSAFGLVLMFIGRYFMKDASLYSILFGFLPFLIGFPLFIVYSVKPQLPLPEEIIADNTQYNVLSLIKELEKIQQKLQITDIEKLICTLKILHLEEQQLDASCIEQLVTLIDNNFEEINSSKINKDTYQNLDSEMEIAQTNLQKIL